LNRLLIPSATVERINFVTMDGIAARSGATDILVQVERFRGA